MMRKGDHTQQHLTFSTPFLKTGYYCMQGCQVEIWKVGAIGLKTGRFGKGIWSSTSLLLLSVKRPV